MASKPCPRCSKPLYAVTMSGAKARSCRSCGGHQVSLDALRSAADPDGVERLWAAFLARSEPGALPCPDCGVYMDAVTQGGVEVDGCRTCRSLWFDPKERRDSIRGPRQRALDPAAVRWSEQQARERGAEAQRPTRSSTDPLDVVEALFKVLEAVFYIV